MPEQEIEASDDYVDGWKDMMEDAQPEIAARVEELRARA